MTKVLIVEDNEMNMRLFSDLLKSRSYDVFECNEGKSALATAKKVKPDLILMDIQMPEVDGLTAIKQIRKSADVAHTKIIAVTAFAMEGDKERILAGGCDGYLSKPISIPTFFATIDEILDR